LGDPKFQKKKYETPSHPWEGERIKAEHELVKKYGLKNKRELWKFQTKLRAMRGQARTLQARLRTKSPQAEKEKELLLKRLYSWGLLEKDAELNDVLSLTVEDLLTRRLQTQVHLKGMAYTIKQARQMIVHRHIALGGRIINVPGYIVKREEEDMIEFAPSSPMKDDMHPMRPKPEEARLLEMTEKAAEEQAESAAGGEESG